MGIFLVKKWIGGVSSGLAKTTMAWSLETMLVVQLEYCKGKDGKHKQELMSSELVEQD